MAFADLKHAQRERLEYLDQCFTWRGMANRRDLLAKFGISEAQAALDFRLYLGRSSDNAPTYDAKRKSYFSQPDHQALAETNETLMEELLLESPPPSPLDQLPALSRRADPKVTSLLFRAMRLRKAISIRYVSMSSGETDDQWIAPSRFASDGERVHLRAYSFKHEGYRDYIPIRVAPESSFVLEDLREILPRDEDWHTLASIYLRPRIGLTKEQADMVRLEYGFSQPTLRVETRKALEFYAKRRWGLDQVGSRLEIERVDYEVKVEESV